MEQIAIDTIPELASAWQELKKTQPALRIRDAAEKLGVSEAELLATTLGNGATRLEGDWTELMKRLPSLGRVMSLTRNDSCVLEHKGSFQKIDIMGTMPHAMATVIGPIESRVFFHAWKYGFAVQTQTPHGSQQSLQFFDGSGTAITKIFLQEPSANRAGSNQEAYDALVKDFTAKEQAPALIITKPTPVNTKKMEEVDQTALLNDWTLMKDTHEFFGMLRKHNVNRLDAVELAKGKFTSPIHKSSLRTLVETAAAQKLPIMIFAGNNGNLQIHQGKIQTIRIMENWLNILDPDFNMHLREDHVESVWVVKKPSEDGVVTGIEVFDKSKNMIVQFFGLRKPGIPELEGWRTLVDQLPSL